MSDSREQAVAALESPMAVVQDAVDQSPVLEDRNAQSFALREDCPIVPLGQDAEGNGFYYKSASDLMVYLKSGEHGRAHLLSLCAPYTDYLFKHYPQWTKGEGGEWIPKPNTFKPENLQPLLMDAAARKGVWNPQQRLRGAGCWRYEDGGLVVHRGVNISLYPADGDLQKFKTGMIGEHFYPAYTDLGEESFENCGNAGKELLKLIERWDWAAPEIDPKLVLGWVGSAMVAGALEWRPMMWVKAPSGSGKSELHKMIKKLFGAGVHSFVDATAAGIRQELKNSSLAVAVDELENSEDNRKVMAVIEQMRLASSGATSARGGADHKSHTFTARSSYLMASVRMPPLLPQDENRITVLSLVKTEHESRMEQIPDAEMKELGLRILGRIIQAWPMFDKEFSSWWKVLKEHGVKDDRACDQVGTLLAMADMLLLSDDELNEPITDGVSESLAAMLAEQAASSQPDWKDWLTFLCSSHPTRNAISMKALTIGEMLGKLIQNKSEDIDLPSYKDTLSRLGLRIADDAEDKKKYLVVANRTNGLIDLHQESHWKGSASSNISGWAQAAESAPNSKKVNSMRFGGVRGRAVAIPIELVNEVVAIGDKYDV